MSMGAIDSWERISNPKKSGAKSGSRLNGNDTTGLDSGSQNCLDEQIKEMEAKWNAANQAAKEGRRSETSKIEINGCVEG